VALSLGMLVIYVPFLQTAFHTVPLSSLDWAIATAVAATLLIGMEAVKLALRAEHRSAAVREPLRGQSPSRARVPCAGEIVRGSRAR
jgi:hypothetical protein